VLRVVNVYPDLLGTYGDGGNGLVVTRRAQWRGIAATLVQAPSDEPLPAAEIYCLGGGEDAPQVRAAELLRASGVLAGAVADGAAVLAVCAGFQIVGRTFPDAEGAAVAGVGLLDVATAKGTGRRAVGEIVAEPLALDGEPPLEVLTGFENHAGVTTVGPDAAPLATVRHGTGNGDGSGTEGGRAGRVVGTYLHGPVLARNPALADRLLGWATGAALGPLDDASVDALRRERLATVTGAGHRRAGRRR
jgi:CobQ-like glutamine amidotransferase family enzyme